MSHILRIGTRSSALALAQSSQIVDVLARLDVPATLVHLSSPGDADQQPLPGRGHEGIFVSSVRDALMDEHIDVALHSFKDVPTETQAHLMVAAVPRRVDPRDTVVGPTRLSRLPAGSRVGTCSVRRAAWVRRIRPDLDIVPIRGNIDARIARVNAGDYDAIILAAAGLIRLGQEHQAMEVIAATSLIPAPAQGALALECRTSDARTRLLLARVDHAPSHLAALAERSVLAAIDPTDSTAIGALAVMRGQRISLIADLGTPDGSERSVRGVIATVRNGEDARRMGLDLADTLTRARMRAA